MPAFGPGGRQAIPSVSLRKSSALFVHGRGPRPYLLRLEVRRDVEQIICLPDLTPDRSGLPSADRGAGAARSGLPLTFRGTPAVWVIGPLRCE